MNRYNEQATLNEQIETLRSMGRPWVGPMALALFLVPALILLYRAFAFREYPLIVFAIFFGFFAAIVFQGTQHIRRAIDGIEASDRMPGKARTWTKEGSESISYMLEVAIAGRGPWTFEFRPQRWEPEDGELDVECRFLPGVSWPVLVLSDKGIMFPKQAPKTLHHASCTDTFWR